MTEQQILDNLITKDVRNRQVNSYLNWMFANILLSVYVGVFVVYYKFHEIRARCATQLWTFLVGYFAIMVLHLVKKVCMICIWKVAKNPKESEVHINILYLISLFVPEIIWYIFGSIFIYSDLMEVCYESDDNLTKMLWATTVVLIIHSYLYFLMLVLVLIGFCVAYNQFKRRSKT